MTRIRSTCPYLLLTALSCGALAACGAERTASSGQYNGESARHRTAMEAKQAPAGGLTERVAHLEREMATLKTDMTQLAMTYNGLMTTNERIDALLTKLEQGDAEPASVPAVEAAPVKKQAMQKQAAPKPATKPKEPAVLGVRLGEHPGKTRMVIDSSAPVSMISDLDNTEKILLIDLGKTGWDAKKTVSGLSAPLVAGWNVEDVGGSKMLAVQLKKPIKILSTSTLKPVDGKPARLVIDFTAAS